MLLNEKNVYLITRDIQRMFGTAIAFFGVVLVVAFVTGNIAADEIGSLSILETFSIAWSIYWRALIPVGIVLLGARLRFGYEPGQVGDNE